VQHGSKKSIIVVLFTIRCIEAVPATAIVCNEPDIVRSLA
jgi:hypothetical protein